MVCHIARARKPRIAEPHEPTAEPSTLETVGEGKSGGFGRRTFVAIVFLITTFVVAQSVVHLVVVLWLDRVGTVVDLDRSNGLPDIVSTLALGLGAVGAGFLAHQERGGGRQVAAGGLAVLLALATVADLRHDGAHPSSPYGPYVIGVVATAGLLVLLVGAASGSRARITFAVAGLALAFSFFVAGLHRADGWFERERGDLVDECQIVAKEGLELLGWSLVALGLWEEALRRRKVASRFSPTRASRAPAAS